MVKLTARDAGARDDKALAQAGQGAEEAAVPAKPLFLADEPQ